MASCPLRKVRRNVAGRLLRRITNFAMRMKARFADAEPSLCRVMAPNFFRMSSCKCGRIGSRYAHQQARHRLIMGLAEGLLERDRSSV